MDALKVLLVDDDKNIRQTLQVSLKNLGCTVEIADSAENALQILQKSHFDFMLTDVRMTGKNGIELIQECKLLDRPPMIVVMTAYASFENAVAAIQAGAYDYLPKPFSVAQLGHVLDLVKTLVNLKKENERLLKTVDELVRDHIKSVLAIEPNQEKAAKILGITTVTLWRKRKEYGLP